MCLPFSLLSHSSPSIAASTQALPCDGGASEDPTRSDRVPDCGASRTRVCSSNYRREGQVPTYREEGYDTTRVAWRLRFCMVMHPYIAVWWRIAEEAAPILSSRCRYSDALCNCLRVPALARYACWSDHASDYLLWVCSYFCVNGRDLPRTTMHGSALQLDSATSSYLISASLITCGVYSALQICHKPDLDGRNLERFSNVTNSPMGSILLGNWSNHRRFQLLTLCLLVPNTISARSLERRSLPCPLHSR